MNRLKVLRKDKAVLEIVNYLKINLDDYMLYESDKKAIPSEILKKLADYYDTSIDYLLYYTDEIKSYKK